MLHKDLESLTAPMRKRVDLFLPKLTEAGIKYVIIETLRNQDVQVAYYAQGRRLLDTTNELRKQAGLAPLKRKDASDTGGLAVITKCDGINTPSNHQSGNAMDIAPMKEDGSPNWKATDDEWFAIGKIAEECGLVWGGRFGSKDGALGWDAAHVELRR